MSQFQYTAFVRLGSGDAADITTDVICDLNEEEIEKLNSLKSSYQGKPHRISHEVKHLYPGLHRKLMKLAHDDVECMLTENAVENGYTEIYETDLFARDCDEGKFVKTEDEDEQASLTRWHQEECARLEAMTRHDRNIYLTQRYLIELDFDENDYSYFF